MKTYFQKSNSLFAINGIIEVSMSDEHYAQLKDILLDAGSKEVLVYKEAKAKAEAERIALDNTPAKITERLTQAVQSYIDAPAIKLRYASTNSMISYLNSTVEQFVKEAKAGVAFRDACWVKAREIETDVLAGKRKPPSAEELLKELPVWKL